MDYLDSLCYLNLLVLCVSHQYCQNTNNQQGQIIAVKVSVSVAFALFLGVLAFHVILSVKNHQVEETMEHKAEISKYRMSE